MKCIFLNTHKYIALIVCSLLSYNAYADTLEQAIDYTLQTNPNILISNSNRKATDEVLRRSQSDYFPDVDFTGGYGREHSRNTTTRLSPNGPDLTLNRGEAGLFVTQNIFEGFRTVNEVARRHAEVNSAALSVNSTAQETTFRVVEVYLNILRRQELIEIARKNVQSHQRTYLMIKKRQQGGLSHKADVTQAGGRLALAKSNLIVEENRLADAKVNYFEIVGKEANNLSLPKGFPHKLPKNQASTVRLALNINPDLKAANQDVVSAYRQYQASKAIFYPTINLELSSTRNNNIDGVKGINYDDMAMLTANYNLFNGGGDIARKKEIANLYQATIENKNLTARQTKQKAQSAWLSYYTAHQQIPYLRTHRNDAKETVSLYRKQFQLGQRTLLDLLDAESEYFTSSSSYTNGHYRELLGKYLLFKNIGNLVQILNLPLPMQAYIEPGRLHS